ncbi:MAG TPA: UDP-N-acetylmuramoyl-L-alanyl-D-glutamate--2,6-diaminopimelate ligase [Pseudomonadales bacterium]|nr:UDP-N-acetylmuramoyl-L-alanyl-D-glutamate--2,6-diaminopimelate ligase [Pseudomonadales bacterium]
MSPLTRSLAELLASADVRTVEPSPALATVNLAGLAMDSRRLRPGELFLAVPGQTADGRAFIADVAGRGAAAILVDGAVRDEDRAAAGSVPIFAVEELGRLAGLLASAWHDHPSRAMRVLGVTGTNGKTSASHHLADMLGALGERAGVCGTLGNGFPGQLHGTGLTTADAVTLQYSLASLRDAGAGWVAMEVSSHALDQGRVSGVAFAGALFTNLTRDHLDYHGTMDAYGEAKRQLFLAPGLEVAALNRDDAFARSLAERIPAAVELFDFSLDDAAASLRATDIDYGTSGTRAHIESVWGEGDLRTRLLGNFSLSNLLGAVTLLVGLGLPLRDVLAAADVEPVPGRMQSFAHPHGFSVVVDYAHTPDALEQALQVLRKHFDRALICVFGCGGERDAGKRPEMARAAARWADRIIVTDDNPRGEDGDAIVADIVAGMAENTAYAVERDRRRAIEQACSAARAGDVVLIAGKGHEDYQDGAAGRVHYSDLETVARLVANAEQKRGRDAAGA